MKRTKLVFGTFAPAGLASERLREIVSAGFDDLLLFRALFCRLGDFLLEEFFVTGGVEGQGDGLIRPR